MKGQSLVVQFMLFFMIGLGLFTAIGGIFRLQSDLIREDIADANRKLIGSYISSIAISMASDCKGCNFTSTSLRLRNVTASYITWLNFSSRGLQVFSEPGGGNTSVSIHNFNESSILRGNSSSALLTRLIINFTSNKWELSR